MSHRANRVKNRATWHRAVSPWEGDITLLINTLNMLVQPVTNSLSRALFLHLVHKGTLSSPVKSPAEIPVRPSPSLMTISGEETRLDWGDLCKSGQPLGRHCFLVPDLTDQPVTIRSRVLPGINIKPTVCISWNVPSSPLSLLIAKSSPASFKN